MLDVPLKNFALYWNQARKLDVTGKTFSVIFWLIFDSECFWIMQWAWPGAISINRNTSKITKYLYLWREKHLFVFEILFRVFRRSVYWNISLREKCPNTEFFLVRIFPLFRSKCGKIRTRKNAVFGHFSRNMCLINNSKCLRHITFDLKSGNFFFHSFFILG